MGNIKLEDVKKKLDKYFADVTPEQLDKDLKEAGLGFYTDQTPRAEVTLDCGVKHPCQRIKNYIKVCRSKKETKAYEILADREAYIMINVKVYLCPQCAKEMDV